MVDLHLLERRIAPRVQRYVAMALAFVLTVAVALQLAPPAHAAAEANASGVTASVTLNGQKYNGLDVVAPGDTLHMQVQYGQDTERGSTARFTVSPNAVFSTDVPAGNTAIERIDRVDDHTLAITFAEDWGVTNQGVFGLQFSLTEVEHTATDTITWSVDGKETSLDIIVSPKGNEFGPEHDEYSKSVTPSNLNSFVTVEKDTVKLKEGIQDQKLTYTLSVTTKEAKEALTIADTLPAGLSYDQDSFSATMVTWDESGLNKGEPQEVGFTPAIDQGSFSGKLAVPGPSKATITYTATITDVAAVEALLQEQYDKLEGDARQNFRIDLKNTASFHDGENAQQKKTAKVILQGTKDSIGPDLRAAFKKSADWSSKTQRAGKAGDLQKPINIAYKMTADLRQLQSVGLNQNVIVEDTLPEQLRWVTDADNFISISGLTATRFQGEAPTFQESSQPGEYLVDGNTLWVNVGQDVTRKHSITAQAQLLTVKGITPTEASPPEGALSHQFRNTAAFHYGSDKPYERSRDAAVVLLPAPGDDGDNNEYVFKKSGKAEHTRIQPGESVDIVYTFTVAKDNGIDMRNSTIVDYLEVAAFDLGENLDNVRLRGSYDGKPLGQEDFHLTQNDAGNLEITLNDTGKQVVTNRGTDKDFVVVVELTTKVFEGKETKTIINKATLFGEDNVPLYWSTTESQSTSYGDEAEVRKRVFD
ncbi:MAG: hypothetical protein GXY09_01865, partial [Bacteroidales bacterium]|nr:hypothetical protein [Bacteroidales bacterium]